MSTNSLDKIADLLKNPFFSSKEARERGIHPSLLSYYRKKGILEQLSRGIYRNAKRKIHIPIEWEDVTLTAASIPSGIICLVTALSYYDLTDEIPKKIWIAVPRKSWPPRRPNTKIVRMSNIELGVEKIKMGEIPVSIFNQERTVIDSFRYLSKEIAIKALKRYLKSTEDHKPNIRRLSRYARELHANISSYIETITT